MRVLSVQARTAAVQHRTAHIEYGHGYDALLLGRLCMPEIPSLDLDLAALARIRTRQDFAGALTALREEAGLTVRQVAGKVGVQGAHTTIGDWCSGRALPSTSSQPLLIKVLSVCGVTDEQVEHWLRAWRRVRRGPGRRPSGPEPYRGLATFQPEDTDWFFGREELTTRLIDRLGTLDAAGGGVQVVIGASGAGKSSLLRAGMIAALRTGCLPGSSSWRVVVFTPGSHPMRQLSHECGPAVQDVVESSRAAGRDPIPLRAETLATGRLVLVVDQFEEVFTACDDEDERQRFIDAICAMATAPTGAIVVLGLRADFYAHALRYQPLVAAAQAQLLVGPMSEPELRRAITEPAARAGLTLESGLVEILLHDLTPTAQRTPEGAAHEAGALPLLSHALLATWETAKGHPLGVEHYRGTGGIRGAVAKTAEKAYAALSSDHQEVARRLFLRSRS